MRKIVKYSYIYISLFVVILAIAKNSQAEDFNIPVTWGGFVDANWAYDFNTPASKDRSFATQPARHNEFNINLAYIDAKIENNKIRGRLAFQVGTSVQSNYSSEPTEGSVSGPDLSRHIQEARLGYNLSKNTWIDAGVFFAHVGAESWISKDNLTLTRSLVAEYSPYYLSGVKLTHKFSDHLTTQLLITNGWQNISENNSDKNIGTGIEYSLGSISLAYNTLIGREVSPDLNALPRGSEFRHFHNFIIKSVNDSILDFIIQGDIGFQDKPGSSDISQWYGASLMLRYKINETKKVSLRLEHFYDKDQIVLVTGVAEPMNLVGLSVGYDYKLYENLLWRSEVRFLKAKNEVFPEDQNELNTNNITSTTSLAISY